MKTILIALFAAALWACSNETPPTPTSNQAATTEQPAEAITTNLQPKEESPKEDLEAIKKTALSFHQWVIDNQEKLDKNDKLIIAPSTVKGDNGKAKLDIDSYLKRLKGIGSLSEQFINQEKDRLAPCAALVKKANWEDVEAEPFYDFGGEACSFMEYNYWTKSQEYVAGVKATTVNKKGDAWVVELKMYTEYDGEKTFNDRHIPLVTVVLEEGKYKIAKIDWA